MRLLENIQVALTRADEVLQLASTTRLTRGEDAEEIKSAISFMKFHIEVARVKGYWGTPGSELLASSFRTFAVACAETLRSAAKAVSPAGIVLCSGALARRLDTNFKFIGVTVRQLVRAVEGMSSGNGTRSLPPSSSSSSSSASADTRTSLGGGAKLGDRFNWALKLRVLNQRAARAEVLRRLLEADGGLEPATTAEAASAGGGACGGSGPGSARVATSTSRAAKADPAGARAPADRARSRSSVVLALQGEGMTAATLSNAEAVSELVKELHDLAGESQLMYPEDQQLIHAVADALLYGIDSGGGGVGGGGGGGGCSSRVTSSTRGALPPPAEAPSAPTATLLPQSCVCPLTLQLLRDPVVTAAGHTYEREDAEEWLRRNDTDPKTRERLSCRSLIPNWALKGVIDELLSERGLDHERYDELVSSGGIGAAGAGSGGAAAAGTAAAAGAAAGAGRDAGPAGAAAGRVPSVSSGGTPAGACRGPQATAAAAAAGGRGHTLQAAAPPSVPATASLPGASTAPAANTIDGPAAQGGRSHPAAAAAAAAAGSGYNMNFSLGYPPLGPTSGRRRHRANRWSAADAAAPAPPAPPASAAPSPPAGAGEGPPPPPPPPRNPASFKWSRPRALAEAGGAAPGNEASGSGASGSGASRAGPSGFGASASASSRGLAAGDVPAGSAPALSSGASRFGPPGGGGGGGSGGGGSGGSGVGSAGPAPMWGLGPEVPPQSGRGGGGASRWRAAPQRSSLPVGTVAGGGSAGAPINHHQPTRRRRAPVAAAVGGRAPASTDGWPNAAAPAPAPAAAAVDARTLTLTDGWPSAAAPAPAPAPAAVAAAAAAALDDDDDDDDYTADAIAEMFFSLERSVRARPSATALTGSGGGRGFPAFVDPMARAALDDVSRTSAVLRSIFPPADDFINDFLMQLGAERYR